MFKNVFKIYKKYLPFLIILGIIVFTIFIFLYPVAVESTNEQSSNNTHPVTITFKTNPQSDEIIIYCDDIQKIAQTDSQEIVHNDSITYNFGAKLNCQARNIDDGSEFSSWSELVKSSDNPVTFRALEDGELSANFKKSFTITPAIWSSILSGLAIGLLNTLIIVILLYIPTLIKKRRMSKHMKRIVECCSTFSSDIPNDEMKTCLDEISRKTKDDLKQGKILEKHYEILNNKILQIKDTLKSKGEKNQGIFHFFEYTVNQLLSEYQNILPLLYTDISNVLITTAENTNKKINLKENLKPKFIHFLMKYWKVYGGIIPIKKTNLLIGLDVAYRPGKGGYFPVLLFKRRMRNILKILLSSCYFSLKYEKNHQDDIQKVIDKIHSFEEKIFGKEKEKVSPRFDVILRIIPIIVTIITSSILANLLIPALTSFNIYHILEKPLLVFGLVVFGYTVFIIGYWFIYKYIYNGIKWYNKIIRLNRTKDIEANVYDSLVPIQRLFLPYAFPKIDVLLD